MGEEGQGSWLGYVDWRNRPAMKGRHGGMLAASFVLVTEVFDSIALLSIASNFATYLMHIMHLPPAIASNTVTNFCGTAFFLALFGGFLCDAYSSAYHVFLMSTGVELLGFIILLVQANTPSLLPPPCAHLINSGDECDQVSGTKAMVLFTGLYLVAMGEGGVRGSLPAQGGEQFDEDTVHGRNMRSRFFNYFVFCLSCGVLVAVTGVVWVEDNKGWQWGLGLGAMAVFLSFPVFLSGSRFYRNRIATGSPLTTIAKVIVASMLNPTTAKELETETNTATTTTAAAAPPPMSKDLRFLNRAVERAPIHPSLACTAAQVEEVKAVLRLQPIFLSTLTISLSLSQLGAFTLQQAMTMDTTLFAVRFSPANLSVVSVIFVMIAAPLYDTLVVPALRRLTGVETGIKHLQRMGVGLALSGFAAAAAAVVEARRKRVAWESGVQDLDAGVPMNFAWVAVQLLVIGSADLFTLAGMLELFFAEMPTSMRSLSMSLSWTSIAIGNYLGTAMVTVVNRVTGGGREGGTPWLGGENLNYFQLGRYYWILFGLNVVNFVQYLYWASVYKYRTV